MVNRLAVLAICNHSICKSLVETVMKQTGGIMLGSVYAIFFYKFELVKMDR